MGHARTKPTSSFDFQIPILYGGRMEFFVNLLPLKSDASVLIWLEIRHPGVKLENLVNF
jgi:hypothetical protein